MSWADTRLDDDDNLSAIEAVYALESPIEMGRVEGVDAGVG